MTKAKRPKVTRVRYIGMPLLVPAIVFIIIAIEDRAFGFIPEVMTNAIIVLSLFSMMPLIAYGEHRYQKKVVSILDDENDPDEYMRTINNPEEQLYANGRRYDTKILTEDMQQKIERMLREEVKAEKSKTGKC